VEGPLVAPRPMGVLPVDVRHLGLEGAICAYYLEDPEPTLIDPGPSTSLSELEEGLRAEGVRLESVRHLLLTHVHLDHAGASGHLARRSPELKVHVHEDGAPHMADPEKLVSSTRRTFGDAHDRLWGEVLPVPRHQIGAWRPGDPHPMPGIRPIPTPGHILHHLAWEDEAKGILFAGDSLGIILAPGAPTHPPTPPPSLDLAAWRHTLDRILAPVEVDAFGVTHFGLHTGLHTRRRELRERLDALAERVAAAMEAGPDAEAEDRDAFHRETLELLGPHVPGETVERYFEMFSAGTDWDGMRFHLGRI
jgi:glyoxylase-like metal-dependent hydrolase (beta-lactamase superfamily II)